LIQSEKILISQRTLEMDGCMGCRPNTSEWLLDGFTCFYCQTLPSEKKHAKKRIGIVLDQIKQDDLQRRATILERLVAYLNAR
jgi:hypothetical protein